MRYISRLLVSAITSGAALAACSATGNGHTDVNTPGNQTAQVLTVTPLFSGAPLLTASSGFTTVQRTVIRDDATWRAMWAVIMQNVSPPPELPSVDFTKEMLVVAALGERRSGGFSIAIDSASSTASGAMVVVHVTTPGPQCMNTQAITSPVDVARIPRITGTVQFRDRVTVDDCR